MNLRDRPWMADVEIRIMDSLFEAQQPARVLEWGVGGSTVYWPPRLDCIERWLAVEHTQEYFDAYRGKVADTVYVVRLEPPDYYAGIADFDWTYDLIIVDGRYRVECLDVARSVLAEGGIVVLHDSGRLAYREAWDFYEHSETMYAGEKPDPGGGFRHRGITVFWQDDDVDPAGWCRESKEG